MPASVNTPKLVMRCLKPGCPRKRNANRAMCPDVPLKVVEIHSYCPWHEKAGWKAYPELFYDAQGRRLDPETWRVIA